MLSAHCASGMSCGTVVDGGLTWALCAHSDGPAGVQEAATCHPPPPIGTLDRIGWPGMSSRYQGKSTDVAGTKDGGALQRKQSDP